MLKAARVGDKVAHSNALTGFLIGALVGVAAGLAIGFVIGTGGLGALLLGAVAGAAISYLTETIGTKIGSSIMGPPTGAIATGSANVFVNRKPAARAMLSTADCKESGPQKVAQGSETVFINQWNASRIDDKLQCGAKIIEGSPDVFIGAPPATVMEIDDEIPAWAEWLVVAMGFIGPGFVKGAFKLFTKGGVRAAMMGAKGALRSVARAIKPRNIWNAARRLVGDPVDPVTGEVVEWRLDLAIPAVLPITFARFYGSRSPASGGLLGPRWADEWSQRLVWDAEEQAWIYRDERGAEIPFPDPGPWGDGINSLAPRLRLEARGDVLAVVEQGSDRRIEFAAASGGMATERLISALVDRNGNRIAFRRDALGTLTGLTHSDGHVLDIECRDGRLQAIRLVSGAELEDSATLAGGALELVRYRYDGAGRLAAVDSAVGDSFTYEYDAQHRLTCWTDQADTWARYRYDEEGRCVESWAAEDLHRARFQYLPEQRRTVYFGPRGERSIYRYDELARIVEITDPLGHVEGQEWDECDRVVARTDALGHRTEYGYDEDGNLVSVTDPDGATVRYSYDAAGRPTGMADPLGNLWSQDYDPLGNLVRSRDPLGGEVRYRLDERGRPLAIARAVRESGPYSLTRLEYDRYGRLAAVVDARGGRTSYGRDRLGHLRFERDALGTVTRYRHDRRGNLLEAVLADGARLLAEYDRAGRLSRFTDALGNVTSYRFGAFDLLRETVDPKGGRVAYAYDGDERLTELVNARGEHHRLGYDLAGRLIEETDFGGRTTAWRRDAGGRILERTDPDGAVRRYAWDACGRLLAEAVPGLSRQLEYDARGMVVRALSGGIEVRFERDALGRVLREVQDGRVVESGYDGSGGRNRRVTPHGALGFDYDPSGLLRAARLGGGGQLDGGGRLSFDHDAMGRERLRSDSRGFALEHRWDAMGRLVEQAVAAPGPATPLVERRWRYDRASNPVEISDRRWPALRYAYDANGQVTLAAGGRSRGSRLVEAMVYDAAHNLAGRTRLPPEAAAALETGGSGAAPATAPHAPALPTPALPEAWRLLPGGAVSATPEQRYRYDARGRLVEKREERRGFRPRVWRYDWDGLDRLAQVETPDRGTWRYRYDAFDRRVEKRCVSDGNAAVAYLWDGDTVAEELPLAANDGALAAMEPVVWYHLPGAPAPLAKQQGGQTWYAVTDHLGTVRELVTADGRLGWAAAHDLWGAANRNAAADPEAATDCPHRFPGQWHDAESGLHYNRFRSYDPETGQYLSPDPIGLAGGLRPHGYTTSPTTLIDPLGLAACPVMLARARDAMRSLAGRGLRPGDVGLKTIAGDSKLLGHWNDAMRAAAKGDNGYSRYLTALDNGSQVTKAELNDAFKAVNARFLESARASGYDIAQVHHWNFPKEQFAQQIVDARHLVPVDSRAVHEALHQVTTGGSKWAGPINPINEIPIGDWSNVLR